MDRTSGIPLDLKIVKEKRPSTQAGRYKKVKKQPTCVVKLERTLTQRKSWQAEINEKKQ